MRYVTPVAWLGGVALLAGLVALNDPGRVLGAVAALGWWIAVIVAFHLVPLLLDVVAWRHLFTGRPPFARLLGIRWIGESVNGLFPIPHLGELIRADLARRTGPTGEAGASVVVDVTLGLGTQIPFAALGLLLYARLPDTGAAARALLLVLGVLVFASANLYLVQRAGFFSLAAAVTRRLPERMRRLFDAASARALDTRITLIYHRRTDLALSALWRFAGWVAGAGEIWLALRGLGHPVGIADAIILESLSQAARTAAFAVPGGLGVQDGALLLLCGHLGIGPDTALALSLVKRCRETALGLPGLVAGYVIQARRWRRA